MFAVESYGAVWRFVFVEGRSQREAARVFRLSRETVAKMCRFSLPPGYTRTKPVEKPKLGPLLPVIDAILQADRTAPLKQRHADAFVAALAVPVEEGEHDAHYRIDLDRVFMPRFATFRDAAGHVGTLLHECAHATGAKHRLDRNFEERFKRDWLPIEEACAELTASFVLADLGIAHHPRPDHAA